MDTTEGVFGMFPGSSIHRLVVVLLSHSIHVTVVAFEKCEYTGSISGSFFHTFPW